MTLKVGVIGTGYLGEFHLAKYLSLPDVEVVGFSEVGEDRARAISAKYSVPNFPDFRDLIDRIDAVSIVTPTVTHYKIASTAIEKGVHALIEKPVAAKLSEARKLKSLAAGKGLKIQVGFLERFNPAFREVVGTIERPRFIESRRLAAFKIRALDVDVIFDLMIHDIDLILSIIDSPLISVDAVGLDVLTGKVDLASVRLRFASGAVANLTTSRVSTAPERTMFVITHDKGIIVDFANHTSKIYSRIENKDWDFPLIDRQELNPPKADALKAEIESFVASIARDTIPIVTLDDGIAALDLATRIGKQILKHSP